MVVQSSSHNWPTKIYECLKLGSMFASEACCETFFNCRLYCACAVMLAPLGIITCGALVVQQMYFCGLPSPMVRLCWLVLVSILLVKGGGDQQCGGINELDCVCSICLHATLVCQVEVTGFLSSHGVLSCCILIVVGAWLSAGFRVVFWAHEVPMGVAVTPAVILHPPCTSGVVSHCFIAVHCFYKVFNLSILRFYLVAKFF